MKPDEVLTIVRLTDKTVDLAQRLDRLDATLDKKYAEFTTTVTRELSASSNVSTLLLVAVVPLIIGFAYSIWRDRQPTSPEAKS